VKNIIRHTTYLFWTFLEVFSHTGISRLVLFPIAAYLIGKNEFGLFATVLSVILIIGTQPSNGLSLGLLRNLAHYQDQQQRQLCSTAVRMCHKFLIYFVLIALVVIFGVFASGLIGKKACLCLTFLAMSLYAENEFMLILTPMRYKRLFKERSLWHLGCSLCVLVFGIAGCFIFGVVGLAFGMMSANFLMCFILASKRYEADLKYSVEQAKVLRFIWFQLTLAGMLALAGPHLNKIVLRLYSDNESVADLFAATGITYVFVAPILSSSGLLLSMLSKYKTINEISGYVFKRLFGVMIAGIIIGVVVFGWAGPIMLQLLFPQFGDRALGLFGILIWLIPSSIVTAFIRPLITKFANVAWIPRINFLNVSIMLILTFSLTPHWGLIGAAWSISICSAIVTMVRLVLFCVIYRRSPKAVDCMEQCKRSGIQC